MANITQITKDGKMLLHYEWQPPTGGIQVVEAETYDELMDKAADNYNHLHGRAHELMLKEKLNGAAPQGAITAAPAIELKTRPLTADERMKISREMQDPEKIDAALDLAFEAKLGAKPSQVSESISANARNASVIKARQEAEAWRDMHPEFNPTQKNVVAIASWVQNRNLEFSIENFDKAYAELASELEQRPPSSGEIDPMQDQTAPTSRITVSGRSTEQQPTGQVPTSPRRSMGTTRGTAPASKDFTPEAFRRLSNEERKKLITSGESAKYFPKN